jgi:pepF/M3 family oligoendopeptidase
MTSSLPHWELATVYPDLTSPEYAAAVADYTAQIGALEVLFNSQLAAAGEHTAIPQLALLIGDYVDGYNQVAELKGTLEPYVYGFISTNSRDVVARRRQSELDQISVRLRQLATRFQGWLGTLEPVLEEVIAAGGLAQAHAFALRESAEQSRYLMSEAEEGLAAELALSGVTAWSKLQLTVTSQTTVDFEVDGQMQRLPLPALINLRSHPNADVRRRGYEAELKALAALREPLAACLNGIKGATNTLNRRRGRQDAVHSAIDTARIDRPTLEAMLGAMEESLPTFRRYFQTKARRLGKDKLAWWDLFAPVGASTRTFSFDEARDFILQNFAGFGVELARLAQDAFDQGWIDAEPREGKSGGAFCMGLDRVRESRILCNFDGSLDQVSTVAHELGHAFHNHCLFSAGKTPLQRRTPMTLAETASIMCETIVMQSVLQQTNDPQEELAILETMLIGDAQVIVDIYSRFLFEQEVFQRRVEAELAADDFCAIMQRAQLATYGDGLDERFLHPYMWTWKPHYYRADLSFYNFPYAFGLLFGSGLYAIYQQRGAAFVPDYMQLLASTGEGTAADLAARFGIDIRDRQFWRDSLGIIAQRIERYCAL